MAQDLATYSDPLHTMSFRLSYGDCDPAGIVYYATYYSWFERVSNEWTFLGGFPATRMAELWGVTNVARSSHCDYHLPGRLFDLLDCEMRLRHVGSTSYSMGFTVVHPESRASYATGHIVFVFVTEDFPPRPVPVPEGFKRELRARGCTV